METVLYKKHIEGGHVTEKHKLSKSKQKSVAEPGYISKSKVWSGNKQKQYYEAQVKT